MVFVCDVLLWSSSATASQSGNTLTFEKQGYSYQQSIRHIRKCPHLIDTLYSMKTMRELTAFVDEVKILEENPGNQLVRVEFGLLGIRGALHYRRTIDRKGREITLVLKRYENNFRLVPYPTHFVARYQIAHNGGHTAVRYTQSARTSREMSFFYRAFVRSQMRRFARKLSAIVDRSCQSARKKEGGSR